MPTALFEWPRLLRVAPVFVAVAMLASCDVAQTCTLIGCASGLRVELVNVPTGAITVQAQIPGGSTMEQSLSCATAGGCTSNVHFPDLLPMQVQLTVTSSAGVRSELVTPEYVESYPNGKSCGPACRNGTARLTWQ